MKSLKLFTLSVFFALATAPMHAELNVLRIHAPFAFVVAGKELPAGDYLIEQTSETGVLLIRGQGGSMMVLTTSGEPARRDPGALFTTAGGEKYLKQVQLLGGPARVLYKAK